MNTAPNIGQFIVERDESVELHEGTRVRSCDRSTFIRCNPILICSFSKESAIWSILITYFSTKDGRELCNVYASEAKKFEFFVHFDRFSKYLKYLRIFEKLSK